MKTKIKIIIITIIALVMLVLGLILAINTKKESIKNFQDGGYIISNVYKKNNDSEINKIYFDAKAQYTKHSNDEYSFNNSDGKKNVVTQDNFVHYNNNSIMALKDGVAIDLTDIDSKIISYYNIFSESILTKTSKGYEINNLNENLSFQKLLFKISDKKYLMAADNIVISFSDSQTVSLKNYVEIEYINKNVIKLYNDESEYQTIASNLYLISDNIKINLEYKTISKNNIKYLTMADMVINADDNIEVLPEEKLPVTPTDDNNQGNNQNNQGNQGNNQGNDQNNGGNDIDISDQLGNLVTPGENVDNEDNFIQPTFTVESMEVTSIGFENLKITLEDKSSVLYGNRQVELVDNSTGTVLENLEDWDEGSLIYTINYYTKLKPNSEYTLNIKGQYKIEDTVYDRTFVSKIFRTLDIGLEITEDYVTSDTVSFAIYRNAYSKVKAFSYVIVDSDDQIIVEETKASYNEDDNRIIATVQSTDEKPVRSNSNYKLKITKIQYDADEYSANNIPNLSISYKLKTLKQKPNIEDIKLQSTLDKQKNTIQLSVENLIDNNNGIKSITYNLYNSQDDNGKENLVQTITQNDYKAVTLKIDDLNREQTYYFSVTIEFDDNQKTVIYTSKNSDLINISSIKYPRVVGFSKEEIENHIGADSIAAILKIQDDESYIRQYGIKQFRIVLKENGGLGTYSTVITIDVPNTAITEFDLPIAVTGLKPNTQYILNVYLVGVTSTTNYIGYETFTTKKPQHLYLTYKNLNSDSLDSFDLNNGEMFAFELGIDVEKDKIKTESTESDEQHYTSDSLSYMELELQKCNSSKKCESLSQFVRTIPKTQNDENKELDKLKRHESVLLKASDFSYYNSDYTLVDGEHYEVVIKAVSAMNYEFPIMLKNSQSEGLENFEETDKFELNIIDNIPSLTVDLKEVPYSECSNNKNLNDGACGTDLDLDTIIGYKLDIQPIKSTKGESTDGFKYEIYQLSECTEETVRNVKKPYYGSGLLKINSDDNQIFYVSMKTTGMNRGTNYCLKYTSTYNKQQEVGKIGYISLFSLKQAAKITGYISTYNEDNFKFKINRDDPDKAAESISLIVGGSMKENVKFSDEPSLEINGKYGPSTKFSLNLFENRGNGFSENGEKIYEDTLEKIYSFTDPDNPINLMISSSKGNIIIKLLIDDVKGANIYGLKFNNGEYLKLNKEVDYYTTVIPSTDFKTYGIGIEGENGNETAVIPKISIVYDSGMIEESKTSFFIKNLENQNEKNYLADESKKEFDTIQNAKIYSNDNNIIKLSEYNSSSSNSQWIGQRYENFLIHTNKVGESTNVLLVDELGNALGEDNSIPYTRILELQERKIVYKTNGAKIFFKLNSSDVKDGEKIRFILKNKTDELEAITDKDSSVLEDTLNFDLSLDSTKTYQYSLSILNKDGTIKDYYYYSGLKQEDVPISTIKSLVISNRDATYEKKYWSLDDKNSLEFGKNLNYKFSVDSSLYELNKDENGNATEEVGYNLYLVDVDVSNNFDLDNCKNDQECFKIANYSVGEDNYDFSIAEPDGTTKISSNSNLLNIVRNKIFTIKELNKTFDVVIRPFVFVKEESKYIYLLPVTLNINKKIEISNGEPNVSISNNLTAVELQVDDKNGMLSKCDGYSLINQNLNTYFPTYDKSNKNYHFEILRKLAEEKFETIGYAPIGFNKKSSKANLANFFKAYGNGKYRYQITYCLINSEKSSTKYIDVEINNISDLNISITPTGLGSYILTMIDPNVEKKEMIKIIEYTVLYEDGTHYSFTYNNVDSITGSIDKGGNDFVFIEIQGSFSILLPYESRIKLATSITVNLLDEKRNVIAQASG